jgi:hypothetical protein
MVDIAAGVALAVAGLASVPHAMRLATAPWRAPTPHDAWYEDVDGKSTPEDVADFSASLRRAKWALAVTAVGGVGVAGAVVWTATPWTMSFADVAALVIWAAVLVVQTPAVWTGWTEAYALGLWTFVSAAAATTIAITQLSSTSRTFTSQELYLQIGQVCAGFAVAVAATSLRQRPHLVDARGRSVDWQYSVSARERYTYAFMWRIISRARESGEDLAADDIFRPDHAVTARTMYEDWQARRMDESKPLWWRIVAAHFWSLALSWAILIAQAVALYLPAYFVLLIVAMLEENGGEQRGSRQMWMLVAGIMFVLLVDAVSGGGGFFFS